MLYSENLSKIITYCQQEAKRLRNSIVEPEHLVLSILRLGKGKAYDAISTKTEVKTLKKEIDEKIKNKGEYVEVSEEEKIPFSTHSDRILRLMDLEAKAMKAQEDDDRHLLLAILKDGESFVAEILNQHNVNYDNVRKVVVAPKAAADYLEEDPEDSKGQVFEEKTIKNRKSSTPALDTFGTDLTRIALENKIDPVIGREKEIDRIIQVLSRRKKNNPVLIGEPGVGKSAIVEGLALCISQNDVSHALYGKRIISLDLGQMVAGTKYRGQFEERLEAVLKELKEHQEVILFLDEIHTLIGAGGASGSLDAANMLKPALSRGEIQCIGATTLNEYRNSIEKDGALERRFQKIIVEPTDEEETIEILRRIAPYYEAYHNVHYTDEALKACVKLSGRYISDRVFPDKAIDALDEAGAHAHVMAVHVPESIRDIKQQLADIKTETDKVLAQHKYEQAIALRDKERDLQMALTQETSRWKSNEENQRVSIGVEDIARSVSLISGIPVQRIAQEESQKLKNMGAQLRGRVIGQDKAVEELVRSIQRNRLGLKNPNKPIGTFLFIGPTGVGKTHLAQCLAEEMFGTKDAIIRVDMSEFMEKFSASRLTGAPPGYVGYEEGGQLTEQVRRKPYSIVLFDEIEKAHPDVYNLLLQVMDEGRLTDSVGRHINFKNTVIIMTSNVGSRQVKEFGKGIGFTSEDSITDANAESITRKALNKQFQPEFLNRIDDIIMFGQLGRDDIFKIIDLELKELYARVEQLGYHLELTTEAKDFIATKGYDVQYGARPLKRALQRYAEDPLADLLLGNELSEGTTIELRKEGDSIVAEIK